MQALSPILDQPQTIDWSATQADPSYALANQDLSFEVDAQTDLRNLFWPWADEFYARSIRLRVSAPREDELTPMVTRLYPGHQELILGTEGIIVSKRLAVPRQSDYDRAVLWLLDCQAEGDRLLRLEVTIDWGEALTQRMVDGLLVAQRNPGPARGIYQQSNAELTCVFGNPQARPDSVNLDSPQHAHLVYHVLVNGMVEVPLLLALSDVGEQMAWSGFLALRDPDRAFELSAKAWASVLQTGRLWTPDTNLNQALHAAKLAALRQVQRLRTGFAATDRQVIHTPALVNSIDGMDVTLSRNLLAHLRRLAEASEGRLPTTVPVRSKEPILDPGAALLETNRAYLQALQQHLAHHWDAELLAAHYGAVQLCTEALIRVRIQQSPLEVDMASTLHHALHLALTLAQWQQDEVNSVRWESEIREVVRLVPAVAGHDAEQDDFLRDWPARTQWQPAPDQPWRFGNVWGGIELAGQTIWQGCGLARQGDQWWVAPKWPAAWRWWALVNLPLAAGALTLVWDGTTLHSTLPVQSALPVQQHEQIRVRGAGELDFDLHFEFQTDRADATTRSIFRPEF
ncbi:MAG: hypothetical protein R3C14_51470 [Caldilineaceae bacterium]